MPIDDSETVDATVEAVHQPDPPLVRICVDPWVKGWKIVEREEI